MALEEPKVVVDLNNGVATLNTIPIEAKELRVVVNYLKFAENFFSSEPSKPFPDEPSKRELHELVDHLEKKVSEAEAKAAKAKKDRYTCSLTGDRTKAYIEDLIKSAGFKNKEEGIDTDPKTIRHILAFDVNHLKATNDDLGHYTGGDLLLKTFSEALNIATEKTGGEVARPGGDEFVVVSTSEKPTKELIEVFREEIHKAKGKLLQAAREKMPEILEEVYSKIDENLTGKKRTKEEEVKKQKVENLLSAIDTWDGSLGSLGLATVETIAQEATAEEMDLETTLRKTLRQADQYCLRDKEETKIQYPLSKTLNRRETDIEEKKTDGQADDQGSSTYQKKKPSPFSKDPEAYRKLFQTTTSRTTPNHQPTTGGKTI